MRDIVIIGAGPAGISAALYSKRAGADVLVLYEGNSNLEKAEKIDNYYGFINGIDGKVLYNNGIEQAQNLGIDVKKEEVIDIQKEDEYFKIKTNKEEYISKVAIISTGSKILKPNIKGISEFEGKGISYCAICDGFFYKNKNVVVIGNGAFAENEANELKNIANNVKILTNGETAKIDSEFEIINKKISQIHGEEKVEIIEFDDGSKLDVDGIFIALGKAGGSDFAKKIGVMLNKNNIMTDENMQTNVKGLYACGDTTGGLLQINKSIYEGAKAGLSAAKYVVKNSGQ